LYTLVDSPVITGEYLRELPLTAPGQSPPILMDVAADSAAALAMPAETEQEYKNLVREAEALFGATHFRDYHFLLSLSNHVTHFGLEHHESNDSRTDEAGLVEPTARLNMAGLLPHEFVHSWNGKYRRPADLTTPDYEQPMQDDLLWVYEGLTSYLGDMLTARSGLRTPQQAREELALMAARLDHEPGRTWRPLQDTATAAPILYDAPSSWENWRRGVDFYDEGVLIWLEADSLIRQQTNNRKSLDDFCKLFYGAPSLPSNQAPFVKTYTFDDVVNAMNQVAPYDWRTFFRKRLDSTAPHAPLGGIENSGWKLVYSDAESEVIKASESEHKVLDLRFSIGLLLREDGTVIDSIFFMPAAQAGIMPGMKVVAVNGRKFSTNVLHNAIAAAKGTSAPLDLLVENADYFKTCRLNYHEGERYPHLERETGKPDLLTDILKAHAR
jgi:predicted metalloprotease with PDZ domain